ncbi:hypothetical protein K438DRAFT_1935176 [Mycena galopus ATCC 62051]|nr:hypothetical protein K438DRAFT_1935176 [Mycena galopus ATCC 62051]
MLPQELVDIIVGIVDVGDVASLKAFSLVSLSFCAATQPILFRSLTLKGHVRPSNYAAASRLFNESPHIGAYVKELTMELPLATYLEGRKGIPAVLAKLTAVRRCIIDGGIDYKWDSLCDATLLEFVSRQPLQYLRLRAVKEIPPSWVKSFVASVPKLSFSLVTLRSDCSPDPALPSMPITELVLDKGTTDVSDLFAAQGYAIPLHRLTFHDGYPLVAAAAPTLHHLRIGTPSISARGLEWQSVTSLPSLISFDIEVGFEDRTEAWVRDALTSIMRAKVPAGSGSRFRHLEEIVITYLPMWEYTPPGEAYGHFLEHIDTAISSLVPHPRLRWRLRFVGTGREERFLDLATFIVGQMPLLDALDRLTFETYEPSKWNDEFLEIGGRD